jgi:SpoIID/LytB domain protein
MFSGSAVHDSADAAVGATIDLSGHGYGHGRGLGQWGAYGYATRYGYSYDRILATYYGGTTLGWQNNDALTVHLTALSGTRLKVTSSRDFYVGGLRMAANTAAAVQARPDGTFVISTSYGCNQPDAWTAPVANGRFTSSVAAPGGDLGAMLSVCTSPGTSNATKQYRGELNAIFADGAQRAINVVALEDYLRAVVPRESPASWADSGGIEALKAQSVAARSYAMAETRASWAKTCDTTSCQVYGGAGANGVSLEDARADAAVAGTAGRVLRFSDGKVVRAEFSSSTGGYTAGGAFPAVPDLGDSVSPYHNWTKTLLSSDVAAAYGVGTLLDFMVASRNGLGADGGRVLSVVIKGTAKTVTVTGDDVRIKFGLRSNWFTVRNIQPELFVSSANASGAAFTGFTFGNRADVPLYCDWDGDGVDTPGVYRAGMFAFTAAPDGHGTYTSIYYGNPGDQPLCGDWNGDGVDTIGVWRNGIVYLRNSNTQGGVDMSFAFGAAGDVALTGDWNGDGTDTFGVFRNGTFYQSGSNVRPYPFTTAYFGAFGDHPVVGDWAGAGYDAVGVKRSATFYLAGQAGDPYVTTNVAFGAQWDTPLAADTNGDGVDQVAVGRGF